MSIQVKQNNTWHTVSRPYVKVNGAWKGVLTVQNKVSGSWKTTYQYIEYVNVYFYENGVLVSTKTIQKDSLLTLPTITSTPIVAGNNTTVEKAGWYESTSSSLPTTSSSNNFASYAEGSRVSISKNIYFHAVYKITTTTATTSKEKGEQKIVEIQGDYGVSDYWEDVGTISGSVTDAWPESEYTTYKYIKKPVQTYEWAGYTEFAAGTYAQYPDACAFAFKNYGLKNYLDIGWIETVLKQGTFSATEKTISVSYTVQKSSTVKIGYIKSEANRFLLNADGGIERYPTSGDTGGLPSSTKDVYEHAVLKIKYFPTVIKTNTVTNITYHC